MYKRQDNDEKALRDVVEDLKYTPGYGKLYVAQVPRGISMASFESMVMRANTMWNVDIVVMDYLALLNSGRPRQSLNQEQSDTLKAAKQMAATFDGGRGIPLFSPWQVSRSAWEQAKKVGAYSLSALAETSEACLLYTSPSPRD